MKCHYCGSEITGNEIFCRYCGTRQQDAPRSEPVAVAAPAPTYEEPAVCAAPEAAPVPKAAPVFEERTFGWQPYGGAPAPAEPLFDFEKAAAPKLRLPTKRGLAKMILLGILTLGIYPIVIWSRLVGEVNMVASRYDGERSMSYFGMLLLSPITLGIHSLVWIHKLCRRIGAELQRRSIFYSFGAKDFWLWNVLFSFLSSVCLGIGSYLAASGYENIILWVLLLVGMIAFAGPFVFVHKLMKSMNKMNEHFNENG